MLKNLCARAYTYVCVQLTTDLISFIPCAGVGAGLGVMFGSLINGAARNPNIAKQLVGYALLGFALTESIALFSLLVVFLILFA
jgi:F-type H+-transporting ATPase subunit c